MYGSYYISDKIEIGFVLNWYNRLCILSIWQSRNTWKMGFGDICMGNSLTIFLIWQAPSCLWLVPWQETLDFYKWKESELQNAFMVLNQLSKNNSNSIAICSEQSRQILKESGSVQEWCWEAILESNSIEFGIWSQELT